MSEKIDDGGPAFPLTEDAVNFKNKDFPMQGMSLRDWFAGMALQGILSDSNTINSIRNATREKTGEAFNQLLGEMVFETADALLEARVK